MTTTYRPPRSRDAVDAIRGFAYQVHVTALRWLDLADTEVLELEVGEDIDRISATLDNEERLLEQVKLLNSSNLTLRSPQAREFLCNAYDHIRNNAGLRLRFLITTNANVGRETPRVSGVDGSGIHYWTAISSRTDLAERDVAGLRSVLCTDRRPRSVPRPLWAAYQEFVASSTHIEFLDFIRVIEWSTAGPDAAEVRAMVAAQLANRLGGPTTTSGRIQAAHHRIVHRVWDVICGPAPRRLTPEDLASELRSPDLSEDGESAVAWLLSTMATLEPRVARIEPLVASLSAHVARLDQLLGVTATNPAYALVEPVVEIRPPALVRRTAPRTAVVRSILDGLKDTGWLAIYGKTGIGKSQLARLVVDELHSTTGPWWIRLRDCSEREAVEVLQIALSRIATQLQDSSDREPQDAPNSPLGSSTIVVDDVPRLSKESSLRALLGRLATLLMSGSGLLVTTSYFVMDDDESTAGQKTRLQIECPAFDRQDTAALLSAWGAPPKFFRSHQGVDFIRQTCSGHGTLLAAAARFMMNEGWALTDAILEALKRGEHATSEADEIRRALARSVVDPDTRELLYRLLLVGPYFVADEAVAVATAAPPITRPRERIAETDGLWLQREGVTTWSTSPMLRILNADLLPETAQDCHRRLADRLVGLDFLSPVSGVQLARHLCGAGDSRHAAMTLAQLYLYILRGEDAAARQSAFYALANDLPPEIKAGHRTYLLGLRAALSLENDILVERFLGDFDTQIASAADPTEAPLVAGACMSVCLRLDMHDPLATTKYAGIAARLSEQVATITGEDVSALPFEQLLWLGFSRAPTESHAKQWFSIVRGLSPIQRHRLCNGHGARTEARFVADEIVMAEFHTPESERSWQRALDALNYIVGESTELGLECLLTAALRSRLDVIKLVPWSVEDIRAAAEAAIQLDVRDLWCRLALHEKAADILRRVGDPQRAMVVMTPLLAYHSNETISLEVSLRFSCVAAASDCAPAQVTGLLEQAVDLTRSGSSQVRLIQALSALSLSYWREGANKRAFEAAAESVHLLIEEFTPDEGFWKVIALLQRHAYNYWSGYLDMNGYEVYEEPWPPAFFFDLPDNVATSFDGSTLSTLAGLIAKLAKAVGELGAWEMWAERALDLALAALETSGLHPGLLMSLAPQLVRRGCFEEMIDSAAAIAFIGSTATGASAVENTVERAVLIFAIVPIFLEIWRMSIDGPDDAANAAERVVRHLRVRSSEWSEDELRSTIDLLHVSFVQQCPTVPEIHAVAASAASENRSVYEALGRLRIGTDSQLPIRVRIAAHIEAVRDLQRLHILVGSAADDLLAPILDAHWRGLLASRAFEFKAPRLVASVLLESQGQFGMARACATLVAMADGLGVPLQGELRRFLKESRRGG